MVLLFVCWIDVRVPRTFFFKEINYKFLIYNGSGKDLLQLNYVTICSTRKIYLYGHQYIGRQYLVTEHSNFCLIYKGLCLKEWHVASERVWYPRGNQPSVTSLEYWTKWRKVFPLFKGVSPQLPQLNVIWNAEASDTNIAYLWLENEWFQLYTFYYFP